MWVDSHMCLLYNRLRVKRSRLIIIFFLGRFTVNVREKEIRSCTYITQRPGMTAFISAENLDTLKYQCSYTCANDADDILTVANIKS